MRTRVMIAALLGLALTSAGCASTTSTAPAPLPAWSADAVGHGSKLLVLRTAGTTASPDCLEVDDVTSGLATRLWTAPNGWNARLLCTDRAGIAIALSRRAQTDTGSRTATMPSGGTSYTAWAEPIDQQIVVLRPDGSLLQSHLPTGSIGVVSSAAFLGDTLVIARQGPMMHYATPAEPALMDARGNFTLLPSGAVRLEHGQGLRSLVTLPGGDAAAGIFQGYGPLASRPTLGIVRLHGGSLEVTQTAPRRFGETLYSMAAGATTGTVIFALETPWTGFGPAELVQANVFATPAGNTVLARGVWKREQYANGPASEASMGGGRYVVALTLLPVTFGYMSPGDERQLRSQPTPSSALETIDASGAPHPTSVRLFVHYDEQGGQGWPNGERTDTWLWLGAFGR
jgi:hypothetical protein